MSKCPHCQTPLLDSDLRAGRCPACRKPLAATQKPGPDSESGQGAASGAARTIDDDAALPRQPASASRDTLDDQPQAAPPRSPAQFTTVPETPEQPPRDPRATPTIDDDQATKAVAAEPDPFIDSGTVGETPLDQTIDSVHVVDAKAQRKEGTVDDELAKTIDSAQLSVPVTPPDKKTVNDKIAQTIDSVQTPGAAKPPGKGTVHDEIAQTVDSVTMDEGKQPKKQGTVDERHGAQTMQYQSGESDQPVKKPGTVADRRIAATLDSGELAPAMVDRVRATWEGTINEQASPRTSLKAEIGGGEGRSTLVIQPRVFRRAMHAQAINADYDLLEMLGEGGMGMVYAARQASVDRTVAVKMLKTDTAADQVQRHKFLAEAVVTGDLEHPNIVPIYDLGMNDEGALFYSMKRVQGTPWMDVVHEKSLHENIEILMKVADAMAFAHSRGVIHRDLKPENVMLGGYGEVLVMDWGLAIATSQARQAGGLKPSTSMGGTPAYMAPEMAAGPFERISMLSDVYLLGAMLYEVVTGRPPHTGKDVMKCLFAAAKNDIQPTEHEGELIDIARKAMATNPKDRYGSVLEFQEAIRQYLAHSESIALSTRAAEDLEQARKSDDYRDYARALFGFQEAVALWEGNARARSGVLEASLVYAQCAMNKGDYDLGAGLLDASEPDHERLLTQIRAAQHERDARHGRIKVLRRALVAGVAVFCMVVTVAAGVIWNEKNKAQVARDDAIAAEAEATKQRDAAIEARKQEETAKLAAVAAEEEATKQRDAAEMARLAAEKAKELEEAAKLEAVAAEEEAKKQRDAAEMARLAAVKAKELEEAAKLKAVAAETEAKEQRDAAEMARLAAVKAKELEEAAKLKAVAAEDEAKKQRDAAEIARNAAEYEAYVAQIGLAAAKIDENAYDIARELLDSCPDKFKNWEWGRLRYLCDQKVVDFDRGDASQPIEAVAFDSQGERFVTGGWGGVLRVWDAESNDEPLLSIQAGGDRVTAVAFSHDGKYLASGSDDPFAFASIWNAKSGELVQVLQGHTGPVYSLAFTRDGKRILTGSADGTARLWNVENGELLRTYQGHSWLVWCVAFSPDETQFVTASQDGTAIVWSVETGEKLPPFRGHRGPVYAAAFSPDGQYVATGGYDKRVLIWRPDELQEYDYRAAAAAFAREQAGDTASSGGALSTGDTASYAALSGHTAAVRSLRFSRDGKLILSASHDNTLIVWDAIAGTAYKTLRGHGSWVRSCDLSPDGKWALSGSYDRKAKLWDIEGYEELRVLKGRVLEGHVDEILAASFSRDGREIVTASRDRTARTWDFASGQLLHTFEEGHAFLATRVLFIPDNKQPRLVTSAVDSTVRIWDLAGGTQIEQLEGTGRSAAVAVSHDGRWVLTGGEGKTAKLWDVSGVHFDAGAAAEGDREPIAPVRVLPGNKAEVTAVAFSLDDSQLFLGDANGRCTLYSRETGEVIRTWSVHTGRIVDAVFLPDGKRLLTASADKTATQWGLASGEEIQGRIFKHPAAVTAIDVSDDGRFALTACADGELRYWNVDTAELLWTVTPHSGSATLSENLRFLMNERSWTIEHLAELAQIPVERMRDIVADRAMVAVADAELTRLAGALDSSVARLQKSVVRSVEIAPDGQSAAIAASAGRTVRLLNLKTGEEIAAHAADGSNAPLFDLRHAGAVRGITFSPDGKSLATVGGDEARLFDLQTHREVMDFSPHGSVASAGFSPDGSRIVTASWDNSARIWNVDTGRDEIKLEGPEGHTARVNSAVYSHDATRVLTASDDRTAKIWDANNGSLLATLEGHSGAVAWAIFSDDDTKVVTASRDSTARIWDAATGKMLVELKGDQGHTDGVLCAAISNDGKLIVTGSGDDTAKIWNAKTGEVLFTLAGHTASVNSVAISPDGRRVLTGSADFTAKLWDATSGKEVLTLKAHDQEVTSVSFSDDGRYALTASRDATAIVWLAKEWPVVAIEEGEAPAEGDAPVAPKLDDPFGEAESVDSSLKK